MSKKPAIPRAENLQNDRVRALQKVPDMPVTADGVGAGSTYFSPLQTRSQRAKGNNPPKELSLEKIKKANKRREASAIETALKNQNRQQVMDKTEKKKSEGNEAIGKAVTPPSSNKKSRSRPNKNTN